MPRDRVMVLSEMALFPFLPLYPAGVTAQCVCLSHFLTAA